MPSQAIWSLTRQGNPKIIAAIVNHTLKPRGVTANVTRRERHLYILLGAAQVPDPEELTSLLCTLITSLNLETIEAVVVFGYQQGEPAIAWRRIIPLTASPSEATPNPDLTAPLTTSRVDELALSEEPTRWAADDDEDFENPFVLPLTMDDHDLLEWDQEGELARQTLLPTTEPMSDPTLEPTPIEAIATPEAMSDPDLELPSIEAIAEPEILSDPTLEPNHPEAIAAPQVTDRPSLEASSAAVQAEFLDLDLDRIFDPSLLDLEPPVTHDPLTDERITNDDRSASIDAIPDADADSTPDKAGAIVPYRDALAVVPDEELFQRPEAVILIMFAIVIWFWQIYLEVADGTLPDNALTGSALAKRLGVSRSTISRRKSTESFAAWSQSLDPEDIAWVHQDGLFWPQPNDWVESL